MIASPHKPTFNVTAKGQSLERDHLSSLAPPFIVLFVVGCAWWVTTAVAWFAIVITARYPEGLYHFGAGALRWMIRVEAYVLLMIDDYPPFSLS